MTHTLLLEDMHIHSTFSDGKGSLADNIRSAEMRGLLRIGCVDHVRADTTWVPSFLTAIATEQATTPVQLIAGLEAKILDESGRLDVPGEAVGRTLLYAADHRMPWKGDAKLPSFMRRQIEAGKISGAEVIERLVASTIRVVENYPRVVIAHLFSILPKMGLSEDDVPLPLIDELAAAVVAAGAMIEVDERWKCPGTRVVSRFVRADVPVLWSTDSHRPSTIGLYTHAREVATQLDLGVQIRPRAVHHVSP